MGFCQKIFAIGTVSLLLGCKIELGQSAEDSSSYSPSGSLFRCSITYDSPGVYLLEADLSTDACGIEITADGVTVDLNGHTIQGPNNLNTVNYGIVGVNRSNTTIKNGKIDGFGFGIALTTSTGTGRLAHDNVVTDLIVSHSSLRGIQVEGYRAQVLRNQVSDSGGNLYYPDAYGFGIEVMGPDCLVADNTVTDTYGSFTPGTIIGEGVGISFSTYNTYCVAENNTITNSRAVTNKSTMGFWVSTYSLVTLRNNKILNMHYSGLVPTITLLENNDTDIPIAYGAYDRP